MMQATEGVGMPPAASILADLETYNSERIGVHEEVRRRLPIFVGIPALVVVAAFVYSFTSAGGAAGFVMIGGILAVMFLYYWATGPATRLQQSFRNRLIPSAFGFIDGVHYQNGGTPASFAYLPPAATGRFNRSSFDDQIAGRFDGFDFEVYEASLSRKGGKSSTEIFRGVILALRLDQSFPGMLVAAKPVGSVTRFFRDLFGNGGLTQVVTGNPVVDASYEVRSDNPGSALSIASRLTAALDQLHDDWPDQPCRVAVQGNSAFVLLPTVRNFFELPGIEQPCDYDQHISPMVTDIRKMLQTARLMKDAIDG